MIKRVTIFLILVGVMFTMLWATLQQGDIIKYNNEEQTLLCNPLELFFKQNPDKKPQSEIISSDNWRGYIATWEIKDQRLYLINITVATRGESETDIFPQKSVIGEVFPHQKEVVATWYDGLLIIPLGEMVEYVHMGYGSSYEQYLLIQVKKGEIIREKVLAGNDYMAFKKRQFAEFKKTQEYRDKVAELNKDRAGDRSEESLDSFLFVYHTSFTTEFLTDLE